MLRREIKFKALDRAGKWVFGLLLKKGDAYYIVNENSLETEILDWSLSQFVMSLSTFDKNDSKIDVYEGDVLRVQRYSKNDTYIVLVESISSLPSDLFGSSVLGRKIWGNMFYWHYHKSVPAQLEHFWRRMYDE